MSGISPMRQGQTDPPAHLKFIDDTGKPIPFPSGTTFTLYLYDPKVNQITLGAGTFTVSNGPQGLVDYNWDPTDTQSRAGAYKLFASYTLPSGGHGFGDELDWIVKPLFVQQ